jgi:hypothetical protein
MTDTIPVTKMDFEDKVTFLDDKSMVGSMVAMHSRQAGVIVANFSFSGPVYVDTFPHLLANILGDRTSTGGTGGAATTLSADTTAGAVTVSTTATVAAGTIVVIDSGAVAEVRTITAASGAGPYSLTVAALTYPHSSGASVTPITQYQHAVSLVNSGQGQPITHTLTQFTGLPDGTGARQYTSACLTDLTIHFNDATQLLEYDAKGMAFPSQIAGATPTANPTTIVPTASWRGALGINGTVSASPDTTVTDGTIDLKRKIEAIHTLNGSQAPTYMQRGEADINGKFNAVTPDEQQYLRMRNNTQPQFQFVFDNGVAGPLHNAVQIDVNQTAYKTAKPNLSKAAIDFGIDWDAIGNSVNAGASGGLSPGLVTVTNGRAGTTY